MQTKSLSVGRDLTLFFVIAFVWSWLFWLPGVLASTGALALPGPLLFVLGWLGPFGPAVAAFSLTRARQGTAGVRQFWGVGDRRRMGRGG